MRTLFFTPFVFWLFLMVLFHQMVFCENNTTKPGQNPNFSLNPQDVPLFYENNPLTGMKSFTVITSFQLKDLGVQKKVQQSIENALQKLGEIVYLKDNDMRGFGAGNILLIQMGAVSGWDGNEMPISRVSLSIETSVTLDKTKIKTFPMIWSINTFLQEGAESSFEGDLIKAMQKLTNNFIESYRVVNKNLSKGPVFYIYNS